MLNNFIQKFLFSKLPIRGAYVVLSDVWQTISGQKSYPDELQRLLGEMLSANILLTNHLKLDGKVTLQIQNNSKLDTLVSECTNDFNVRATAKISENIVNSDQLKYTDCIASGNIIISILSNTDGLLYQSVVSLDGSSNVIDILENYMIQSEQLKTIFLISYINDKVIAFMLQQMPDYDISFNDEVERVFMLANTLTKQELLNKPLKEILQMLFYEDDITVFESTVVNFKCSCSRDKVVNMLHLLGKNEVYNIIEELGSIAVNCDFCNATYKFSNADVVFIFSEIAEEMKNISTEIH